MAAEEDSVKVCVRVRPLIQREQGDQSNLIWRAENSTISQIDGTRSFNFDRVFNSHETTSQVYQEVAVPIIRSALQGYNGTIFAYGQTSSGKTYTMMGSPDNLGIIPQAVKEIFRIIQEIPNREFLLRVSYMEIYNETVTDLLCDGRKRKPLEVREDFNRNVYVADLTEELVVVPEAVMEWIKKGEKNRHYGQTKMNEHSSRSHTIFRMIVESRERNGPANSENCDGAVMVSHLNLVDLAGSERASQTGAEGLRLKEGCNINRSLFILGQVIKKLSDDTTGVFINYRDSKLTRILQNSLGGNTKTVIICTITTVCFDETLSTLQFASTAKKVKNKPHVNEVLDDEALLKRYRKEILDLKKQLENLEASSESKTQAMAIEEHAQLLEEIQQLRKEREDRIWNLTNIVVASSQASQDDQRVKRKRRVTWAPGKLLNSLYGADRSGFDTGSKMNFNFPKKAKLTEFASLTEIDQSICTEFSDFDDTSRVFDDFAIDLDCNIGNTVTRREKMESDQPIMDFTSETSFQDGALVKDSLATKNKDMDQKLAELENQLQVLTKDYNAEVEKRESFLNEVSSLKQQLKAKEDEKDEVVRTCQMEISSLKNELQSILKDNEVTDGLRTPVEKDCLEVKHQALSPITMSSSHQSCQTEQIQEDFAEEKLPSHIHDVCQEQIKMLEQKIADLEGNSQQSEFVESIQICEALMAERETALNELATLRYSYENLKEEIENLTQDKTSLEKALQDKSETNEFEVLEKETQKEYEAQLIHEITSLKKLVENAELFNQDLEVELENKSKLLEEQDKQIAALKKDVEALQKKARFSDLSECLGGDGEKLCEEVFQLKQSLADAETVTRDAQREAAFLRSANLEMKDKMDELSLRCEQREKDAFTCEKQLEVEKSNYKRMQADLQKELQYAFNEINHLSGLLEGRVPKDLLSRVELEKQLASALQEKSGLEGEVASMSEYKSLPNEIEMLKCQVQKSAEEHHMLQSEKKHSVSVISEQSTKIQEQAECIERLMKELTDVQTMCQQAEQQYSDLNILHEELQKRYSSTDQEIEKKNSDSECLVKEIHELKRSLDDLEGKLSSQVETLQQQAERQSELLEEKLDLEQKHFKLMTEMEKLKEELNTLQALQSTFHTKNSEDSLQEMQNEMKLLIQQREELQSKVEELVAERNILKQDLNENIEMSIETQDELRQTQEDLKQQKQLVANLSKMISDNGKDLAVKVECQENIAEMSMPLDSRTQLQASEVKDEALSNEKMVLETSDQESVISELENIQERLKSAELALASMLEEKNNLLQKLHGLQEELQAVTGQRDELEDIRKSLQLQQDNLRDEKERTEKKVHQLSEQLQLLADRPLQGDLTGLLQEQDQEKENLLETLKAVTEERDQLKLDLQDNIETSIETQDELRNSLEELTKKSQLLDLLKSQQNDLDGLKKDLENKVSHLEEQLQESMTERDQLLNELKQLKDQMIDLGESYSASTHVVMDKETKDHEVQVITEMFADGQMDVTSQLEEAEAVNRLLTERSEHLQQQMHIISQERDLHQQLIDTLTAEKMQLNTDIQRCTENEVIKDRHIEDLVTVIETLKEHLENAKQKLELKEREAMDAADMGNTDNMAELQLLEENLQQRTIQIENMEKEKLELSDKFCALQEELEKVTEYRDDLQCKLESALSENTNIKENMEKIMTSSSTAQEELQRCREELAQQTDLVNSLRLQIPDSVSLQRKETQTEDTPSMGEKALSLQEELLQKSSECEMLLQTQNKLEEAKDALNHEVESLMERLIDTQSNLESVQSEKQQAEEQLLHLQQQLNLSIQEIEELKVTQQRFIAEMDQQPLNGNQEMEQVQGVACQHGDFEESQRTLQNEIEQLRISLKSTESELETLRREKFENDKNLHQLQHNKQIDVLKALNDQQERLEETVPSKPLNSDLDHLLETLKNLESQLATVQNEKVNIEENLCTLKSKMDSITLEKYELQTELQSLQSERNQLKEDLRENIEISIETQEEIRKTQEELQQYKERASQLTKDISGLEQKSSSLERELLETATLLRGANSEKENLEQSKEKMALEIEQLKHELERKGFALEEAEKEILRSSHKIAELTELKNTPEESDPKNFSERNVEKEYLETLENLRRTREELQLQEEKVDHFTTKISLLEDKISLLQSELQDKIIILKEATDEKEILSQAQEKMSSEIEQLIELLKNKDAELELREQEKEEAAQKTIALTEELRNALQERIQLQLLAESRQEEISLLQSELHDQIILLKEATDEKEILSQVQEKMSSEIEQLMELLKNRDTELEQKEQEKEVAAHKTIALTEELRNASQERIQLQLLAESRQEEANKLKEDLKLLQLQHNEFCDQEKVKSGKIEELKTELTLLKEMIDVKASSVLQLEAEKAALQKQVQQYELEIASLRQEQEQCQHLLQRARDEKENIYTDLKDQEKSNEQLRESLSSCQSELEMARKQRDESKDHLTEKVNEVNKIMQQLQQLSSLQQELQQLQQELKDEKMKNHDLSETVDHQEKEIRALRLMQSEPVQDEDDIEKCTEFLHQKNGEMKDLMVNISSSYANEYSLLNSLCSELQTEIEEQNQTMIAIKETLSPTISREFGNMQTEYIKINTQLQTVLNKLKAVYRNAAIKEEQFSIVEDYERDLCSVQKQNDELLLQCQNLEQSGTKWSENATEELKFCELQFLNKLLFNKMEVIKRVEDGFSAVQGILTSMGGYLKEEVTEKEQFRLWLENLKGLHFDLNKFTEGILQENKRITGVGRLLTNNLKTFAQSRIKQDILAYLKQFEVDLQEKKAKNKELQEKMQRLAPFGDSQILEEENARLCDKLRNLNAELKRMQRRIQELEDEVAIAKADAKHKEQKALMLQEKLLSSVAETELLELRANISEKEKTLQAAQREIKFLYEKVAKGAEPFKDEIDHLKSQVVKVEMERMKLSKSTDSQIASLKACVEYKEECVRKLKELLRQSKKDDDDATICPDKNYHSSYPATCGGGSGIVQSTAMLMLQSENAALKREISHYKKKYQQRTRNTSNREEKLKKSQGRSLETPSPLLGSLHQPDASSQNSAEVYKLSAVSPNKSEHPPHYLFSPGKTGMLRKRGMSPSKTKLYKPEVTSPKKAVRHSIPVSSPGKSDLSNKRALSPLRTEGQLPSTLPLSPCKKSRLPENASPVKDKFFDERSKSLPYYPTKFFDNSTLGTLPDEVNTGSTTETNDINKWWDQPDNNKNVNDCKTS